MFFWLYLILDGSAQHFEWEKKLFIDSLATDSIYDKFTEIDVMFADSAYLADSMNGFRFYHRTKLKAQTQIGSDKGFKSAISSHLNNSINSNTNNTLDTLTANTIALVIPSGSNPNWKNIGPDEFNSTVTKGQSPVFDILVQNQNIMYASSEYGGLFKTVDGGVNWKSVPIRLDLGNNQIVQPPLIGIGDVVFDPNDNTFNTIYASLCFGDLFGTGIYRSSNAGNSWEVFYEFSSALSNSSLNDKTETNLTELAIGDAAICNRVFAISAKKIYVFNKTNKLPIAVHNVAHLNGIYDLDIAPNGDIYVSGHKGVIKSANCGASYNLVSNQNLSISIQSDELFNSFDNYFKEVATYPSPPPKWVGTIGQSPSNYRWFPSDNQGNYSGTNPNSITIFPHSSLNNSIRSDFDCKLQPGIINVNIANLYLDPYLDFKIFIKGIAAVNPIEIYSKSTSNSSFTGSINVNVPINEFNYTYIEIVTTSINNSGRVTINGEIDIDYVSNNLIRGRCAIDIHSSGRVYLYEKLEDYGAYSNISCEKEFISLSLDNGATFTSSKSFKIDIDERAPFDIKIIDEVITNSNTLSQSIFALNGLRGHFINVDWINNITETYEDNFQYHNDTREFSTVSINGVKAIIAATDGGVYRTIDITNNFHAINSTNTQLITGKGLVTAEFNGFDMSKEGNVFAGGMMHMAWASYYRNSKLNNRKWKALGFFGDGYDLALNQNNLETEGISGLFSHYDLNDRDQMSLNRTDFNPLNESFINGPIIGVRGKNYHNSWEITLMPNALQFKRDSFYANMSSYVYSGALKIGNDMAKSRDFADRFEGSSTQSMTNVLNCLHISDKNAEVQYMAVNSPTWGKTLSVTSHSSSQAGKLFKSIDGGVTWSAMSMSSFITSASSIDPFYSQSITDITSNPNDENEIWVCFSGFCDNGQLNRRVYHCSNTAASTIVFNNISNNLPNFPAHKIVCYDGESKSLFLGTEYGLWLYDHATGDWMRYAAIKDDLDWAIPVMQYNIPPGRVNDIKIHKGRNKVVVSVYGRGLWEADLPCSLPLNSPEQTIFDSETLKDLDGYVVIENQVIDFNSDIVIEPNIKVIIKNSTLKMGIDKEILIKNGAKLVLQNSTITNNLCNGLWKGIVLEGMGSATNQLSTGLDPKGFPNYNHGALLIFGSTIENAITGIKVGSSGLSSGGVLQTNKFGSRNSEIVNCRFGIEFSPYIPIPKHQESYFRRTDFISNNTFADVRYEELGVNTHLVLNEVYGLVIAGCSFSNSIPSDLLKQTGTYAPDRGVGISNYNSSFFVMKDDGQFGLPMPATFPTTLMCLPIPNSGSGTVASSFIGLRAGIVMGGNGSYNYSKILECKFLNCNYGLWNYENNGLLFCRNELKWDGNMKESGGVTNNFGIYTNTLRLNILDNYFIWDETANGTFTYTAIETHNTGGNSYSQIFHNILNNLNLNPVGGGTENAPAIIGNVIKGYNPYLQLKCNEYSIKSLNWLIFDPDFGTQGEPPPTGQEPTWGAANQWDIEFSIDQIVWLEESPPNSNIFVPYTPSTWEYWTNINDSMQSLNPNRCHPAAISDYDKDNPNKNCNQKDLNLVYCTNEFEEDNGTFGLFKTKFTDNDKKSELFSCNNFLLLDIPQDSKDWTTRDVEILKEEANNGCEMAKQFLNTHGWTEELQNNHQIYFESISSEQLSEQIKVGIINIYPNPNNGSFNVKWTKTVWPVNLSISDLTGKQIESIETEGTIGQYSFNYCNYSAGIYYVRYYDGKHTYIAKLIIHK